MCLDTPTNVARKKLNGGRRSPTVSHSIDQEEAIESVHPALQVAAENDTVHCSIQGQRTSKDWRSAFFADKAISFSGLETLKKLSIGVVCHRGQKSDMCNQDDFFFLAIEGTLIYGVMDGHGKEGDCVSHFVQTHLPEFLLRDGIEGLVAESVNIQEKISKAFTDVQALMESEIPEQCQRSGCTATVLIQCPKQGKLWQQVLATQQQS